MTTRTPITRPVNPAGKTRSRLRTEQAALDMLSGLGFTREDRERIARKIDGKRYPARIVGEYVEIQKRKLAKRRLQRGLPPEQAEAAQANPDLSDVRELEVRLLRRDGIVCNIFADLLRNLERDVIAGLSREEFDERAATIWSTKSALSNDVRKRERDQRANPQEPLPLPVPEVVPDNDDLPPGAAEDILAAA